MSTGNNLNIHRFRVLTGVPGLSHGVFGRHGGVSRPPYESLNVAWTNGDSPDAVGANLARVKECMGAHLLIGSPQVHGDAIHIVDEAALNAARECGPTLVTSPGDALITSLRGVGLIIKIADCQAVFLVDPEAQVIANVHCGWRGSVNGLLLKVVRLLCEVKGCRPENLLASVSPSLGPCCGEFRNFRQELPPLFWDFQENPNHFDFWAITRRQLRKAGLHDKNIEIARRCTVCESQQFFSYRAEGVTGRMAAVIAWN
jgi:polyphenol oxidase